MKLLWLAEANDTELTLSAPPTAAVGKKVASLFEHYEFLMNLESFFLLKAQPVNVKSDKI